MINEIEWLQLKVENFAASALCSINLKEWSATTATARDLPTIYWQESIVYVTLYNNFNSKYTRTCHLPQEMTVVSLSDQLCSKFTPHYCYYPETKHLESILGSLHKGCLREVESECSHKLFRVTAVQNMLKQRVLFRSICLVY